VRLPRISIYVAHRSDGSGTTAIFTDYLSKVSPDWRSGPGSGKTIQWPAGAGARGNEGVAGLVSRGEGFIGYVEWTYALQGRIAIAQLPNPDGAFVSPSVPTITAAVAGSRIPDDFRTSLTNTPGVTTWPMSGFTWALVYRDQRDAPRARALVDFLWWCTHEGQASAADLGYAPLPPDLIVRIETALRSIRVDGRPVLDAG
jgi:phosphate transport system substrate-binding protein